MSERKRTSALQAALEVVDQLTLEEKDMLFEIAYHRSMLIIRTPDIRGGRPHIAGTGVTVQRVVGWYKLGLAPEDIADELGHLTLAQVYAALAYYHANREEIESAISADEAEAGRLARQHYEAAGAQA